MRRPVTAIFFDCDNTLVLSERLAFEASADLVNEILAARDVNLRFTGPQLRTEFVGQSFQDMMVSLRTKYNLSYSLSEAQLDCYASLEEERVVTKLVGKLQPCARANEELERLVSLGRYQLAVVSGSPLRRVLASLDTVGQSRYFAWDNIFSAATSLPVPTYKPDPMVYFHALGATGKSPDECVAVEDSRSGVTAACRAGIPVIGYTGAYEPEE